MGSLSAARWAMVAGLLWVIGIPSMATFAGGSVRVAQAAEEIISVAAPEGLSPSMSSEGPSMPLQVQQIIYNPYSPYGGSFFNGLYYSTAYYGGPIFNSYGYYPYDMMQYQWWPNYQYFGMGVPYPFYVPFFDPSFPSTLGNLAVWCQIVTTIYCANLR